MSKQLVYATEQQRIFTEIRENCVWIVDNCSGRCDVSVGYCKCCAARPTQSSMVSEHTAVVVSDGCGRETILRHILLFPIKNEPRSNM